MSKQADDDDILNFILMSVGEHPHGIVPVTAEKFNVTRLAVHRALNKLLNSKKLIKSGATAWDTKYFLANDRPEITVELSRLAKKKLISRSQAKHITHDLEKFNRVTLDFKGVKFVGQGFVDEIFRVFKNRHPKIMIDYINAKDDVQFMIERGIATARKS